MTEVFETEPYTVDLSRFSEPALRQMRYIRDNKGYSQWEVMEMFNISAEEYFALDSTPTSKEVWDGAMHRPATT